MTKTQFKKFQDKITDEIEKYKEKMIKNSANFVYEHLYEILVYQKLYSHLYNYSEDQPYKVFPKKNILEYFCKKFMKTSYDLETNSIRNFLYYITL